MANSQKEETESASSSVNEVVGWRFLLLFLFDVLHSCWVNTLRLEIDDESRDILLDDANGVYLMWHNRLFVLGKLHRKFLRGGGRTICGLVSASKDGAWLAAYFKLVGAVAIRGSSSARASQALRELVKALEEGCGVGITPDGPRGPCYSMKPGVILGARKAKCRIILVGVEFQSAWRLKSWDRFYIPKPFSKVVLRSEAYASHEEIEANGPAEEVAFLKERMLELNPD